MGNHNTTITSSKSSNQIQIKSLSSSMKRSKTTNSISQNSQQATATTTTTNTTLGCFKCNSKTNNFNKMNNNEDEQEHLGGMLASSVSDLLAESTNIFTKFRNRLKKSNIRVKSTPSSAYTINPVQNSQPDHTDAVAAAAAPVEIPRRSETDYNINLISSSSSNNNNNNNNHHTKNSNKEIKLLSRTFAVHDFKDKALNEDETKRVSDLEEHESLSSYELNDENTSIMNTQSESLCYIDQEEDTCTNCSSSSYSSSNSTSTSVSLSSLNFLNQVNQKLYSHLNTTYPNITTTTNINNTNFNFNINNNFDLLEFSNDNITLYNNFVNCPFYSISKSRNYNYDEKRAPLADSETFTLSGSQSCLNYSIKRIRL